jgi:flagellar M-ring protein FliF
METKRLIFLENRQWRTFALLFVLLLAVLGAAYYYFLRTDYAVLFSDLRPAEASAVVHELDRQGVAYQLRDNGATILVPEDRASSVRVALAGSDLAVKGMVGFELFNQSDMGLTDFAQRVNYQRALQGELARTIMMMEGIESARVHLAMPERSLFHANQGEPKAAVTVIPQKGRHLDESRVAGIQRLVAAAVPDLVLNDVVVLDENGRTISSTAAPDALGAESGEYGSVQQYYHDRASQAVQNVLTGTRFDLRVTIVPVARRDGAERPAAKLPERPSLSPATRDFRLRIVLLTASELSPTDQSLVRNGITGAVGLDETHGDVLTLGVAPIDSPTPAPSTASSSSLTEAKSSAPRQWEFNPSPWWLVLLLLVAVALGFLIFRPQRTTLSIEERERFVKRIRGQLNLGGEDNNVRA